MNLLFIQSLLDKNYDLLLVKLGIVVLFWVLILVASLIDLRFAIRTSRALGNFKTNSWGLRKTGRKIVEYWTLMLLALFVDVGLSCFVLVKDILPILSIFQIPWISIGLFISILVTEIISVKEKIEIRKGATVIPQHTVDLIVNIVKKLGDNGQDKLSALADLLKKEETEESK